MVLLGGSYTGNTGKTDYIDFCGLGIGNVNSKFNLLVINYGGINTGFLLLLIHSCFFRSLYKYPTFLLINWQYDSIMYC